MHLCVPGERLLDGWVGPTVCQDRGPGETAVKTSDEMLSSAAPSQSWEGKHIMNNQHKMTVSEGKKHYVHKKNVKYGWVDGELREGLLFFFRNRFIEV